MEILHTYIFEKDNDKINHLITEGISPNQTDDLGRSALALASACGYIQQAEALLASGADINFSDENDLAYTPLIQATREGKDEMVRWLIEHGAALEKGDSRNGTPLLHACIAAEQDILRYLISCGANINCMDIDGQNSVHILCRYAVSWGSMIITQTIHGVTQEIENPRFHQHTEVLELLLEHGANVNSFTAYGYSPLHLAAESNAYPFITLLVKKGADVNRPNTKGFTPLHAACDKGHLDSATVLIQAGADVNSVDSDGFSPLLGATMSENVELVKLLVHAGAQKDIPSTITYQTVAQGDTPFTVAKKMNNEEIMKLLQ